MFALWREIDLVRRRAQSRTTYRQTRPEGKRSLLGAAVEIMIVLRRQVRGSVRQVGRKLQQAGKLRVGRLRNLHAQTQGLPYGEFDRSFGHEDFAVKVGGDGLAHGDLSCFHGRHYTSRKPRM